MSDIPPNLGQVVAVAAGGTFNMALRSDGTVVAWGENSSGQTNVPPGLTNVVALSAGSIHTLALKADGTVVAWGGNSAGQANVPPGLTNVMAVAAGDAHSLAVLRDGRVIAWGFNSGGQINVPAGLSNVVAVAGGAVHSLALKRDGTVVAWGYNDFGQRDVPPGLNNVVAIDAGYVHSVALRSDGTVVAWGVDWAGQSTVPPGLNNVVAIAASDHTLALRGDGTVVAWGRDEAGQSDVPAGLSNVAAVAAKGWHSLALVIPTAPTITTQPASQTVFAGNSVRLAVLAVGSGPLLYQWRFNGTNLPGAINPALSLPFVSTNQAGGYTVVVANDLGAVTSVVATLTIRDTMPSTRLFDVAADFSDQVNPNGAWSYGWYPSSVTEFHLDAEHSVISGLNAWLSDVAFDGNPGVFFNGTDSAILVDVDTVCRPHRLVFHPGPGGERSVVRWLAPENGVADIRAVFEGRAGHGASVDVHVLLNREPLFARYVWGSGPDSDVSYSGNISVEAGDVIDFVVGYGNGDYAFDTTELDVTIAFRSGLAAPDCTAAPSGLVGWWPGEGGGEDAVGGHNGVPSSSVAFGPGRVGQAFSFNGTNGYLDLAGGFHYQAFTLSMWVNPGAAQVEYADILDTFHNEYANWVIQQNSSIQNQYYFAAPRNGMATYSIFDLTPNQWQHLVVTRDASNHNRVYVNSALVAETQDTGPINYTGQSLRVGAHASNDRYWKGRLDELAVFNRALDANEIAEIYAALGAGMCPLRPTVLNVTPPSWNVNVGATVSFSATAGGSPVLSYQWQFNGTSLAGATNATLSLPAVSRNQAGGYTVVVSNDLGAVTSVVAILTIRDTTPSTRLFDVAADFSDQVNPNGAWSYGWYPSSVPDFHLDIEHAVISGLNAWLSDVAFDGNPAVRFNGTDSPITIGGVVCRPHRLLFHPGPGGERSVVRWIAPGNGVADIRAVFEGRDGQGVSVDVHVLINLQPLFDHYLWGSGPGSDANYSGNIPVAAGDVIDFVVGYGNGDYAFDTTELDATIVFSSDFIVDAARPIVTISPPDPNTPLLPGPLMVQGTASDNVGVAQVLFQVGSGPFETATGTTNWSAVVTLELGMNSIHAKAIDFAGNESELVSRGFFVLSSPLTLALDGAGRAGPLTNGQPLVVGKRYTVRATPRPGNLFSHWSGTFSSANPTLNFTAVPDTALTAHFVTNSFPEIKGRYIGLLYDPGQPTHENGGWFCFNLTGGGVFSGTLTLAGRTRPISGRFGPDRHAHRSIAQPAPKPPIEIDLQLGPGADAVSGTVSAGSVAGELVGYRAPFSAANPATASAGRYTILLSGGMSAAASPFGQGYATLTVTTNGRVTLAGVLADNTPVVQSSLLSGRGDFPFYTSLYRGGGSCFGWVTLLDTATNDVHGLTLWTKPSGLNGRFYPDGLVQELQLLGSRYSPTNRPLLSFSNAVVILEGGNLVGSTTNNVFLNARNTVTVTPPNPDNLSLALSPRAAGFTGRFKNAGTGRVSPLKGVLLQKQNLGGGFFLGTNQSGSVNFGQP